MNHDQPGLEGEDEFERFYFYKKNPHFKCINGAAGEKFLTHCDKIKIYLVHEKTPITIWRQRYRLCIEIDDI